MKIVTAASIVVAATAVAGPLAGVSLGFDGLQDGEQVLDFYNGGFGGLGSGPGPMFDVSFTPGLAADATEIAFGASALVTGFRQL
jgi:hypothetical protein